MPDSPRASIIINNYNYGRFLADAIDSALAQTYPNTEVIVVDDGSTDNSREVMQRYSGRVVTVFKDNGGQGSAYNAGYAVSNGEIICFLDADDTLDATAIAQTVHAFQDRRIVKVEWELTMVDEVGRRIGQVIPEKPLPSVNLRELTISDGPFYDWLITPPGSGNCYSSSMLRDVLPIPESPFRHGADVYLTMLAPIFGEIRRLNEPLGDYRVHKKNNYFGRPLDAMRLRDYLRRFDDCCIQLKCHLRAQGVEADVDRWKKRNINYLWPRRLLEAKSDIEAVVSPGDSYVLVDNNEWGTTEPVAGRRAIPFMECNGNYWGPPSDDQRAIAEAIRLRREKGAAYIVFAWTAYWWLEHYPAFHAWLRSKHTCVLENERLTVFDIREMDHIHAC